MTKVMVKLSIEIYFEYTDDENDVVWSDSIKTLIGSYLEKHKIGLDSYRLEDYISEILKNNNTIIIGDFIKKIKHRKQINIYGNIYIYNNIYIYQMNKILDVVEDIKQNIKDNQYKIIINSLIEIKNEKKKKKQLQDYFTVNKNLMR